MGFELQTHTVEEVVKIEYSNVHQTAMGSQGLLESYKTDTGLALWRGCSELRMGSADFVGKLVDFVERRSAHTLGRANAQS